MERWRHGVAFGRPRRCRSTVRAPAHSGPASAAEEEALGACADLRPDASRVRMALVELGNTGSTGRLVGAEDAFAVARCRGPHSRAWRCCG